jgi:hypothetical protein
MPPPYLRFLNSFSAFLRIPWTRGRPSQALYPYMTTQHRNTKSNVHALSGIRTHAPDRAVSVIQFVSLRDNV